MPAIYICIPRREVAAPGERVSFRRPREIHCHPSSFELASLRGRLDVTVEGYLADPELQQHPDTLVVLQVDDIV